MLNTELRVFFDPASYSIPEGENQVLVLKVDKQFEAPFLINVTFTAGSAVGKCLAGIYLAQCTLHRMSTFVCIWKEVPTYLAVLPCVCIGG